MHDFQPGITPSGLFWTIRVPDSALTIGRGTARLRLTNVDVFDSFQFLGPVEIPATVSMDVTWTATAPATRFTPQSMDPTDPKNFFAELRLATSAGAFSGSNSRGFAFTSANATSAPLFAEMGVERNGSLIGRFSGK